MTNSSTWSSTLGAAQDHKPFMSAVCDINIVPNRIALD